MFSDDIQEIISFDKIYSNQNTQSYLIKIKNGIYAIEESLIPSRFYAYATFVDTKMLICNWNEERI